MDSVTSMALLKQCPDTNREITARLEAAAFQRSKLFCLRCEATNLWLSLHSIQQHGDLLDNFDVESLERRHFSGMVGQQPNAAEIQVRKNLRSDSNLALSLALALW